MSHTMRATDELLKTQREVQQSKDELSAMLNCDVPAFCSIVNTNPFVISVYAAAIAGTITANDLNGSTVCSGSNSGTLTLSGHTGSVVKWQSSANSGSTWSDISNTTTSQSYTNLTTTTQYRAVVQSGTCSAANTPAVVSAKKRLLFLLS